MTSTTLANEVNYSAAVAISESTRQQDIGVAKATLSGATLQTALDGADRGHHGRCVTAAASYNMATPNHRGALNALNQKLPTENFTRSDTSTFTLVGGRYVIAVAATFGGSGLITLVNAAAEVFATFAANGTATLDLKFGVYNYSLTDVTGVTATAVNGVY